MSTRELRNAPESNAAINLCVARWIADDVGLEGHIRDVSEGGCCPTCRADVVRLVDAPPRERVPEVTAEDVLLRFSHRAKGDLIQLPDGQKENGGTWIGRDLFAAIVRVTVEYCAAQNRRPDA